jgi:hypothetical protein
VNSGDLGSIAPKIESNDMMGCTACVNNMAAFQLLHVLQTPSAVFAGSTQLADNLLINARLITLVIPLFGEHLFSLSIAVPDRSRSAAITTIHLNLETIH